jgi:hypothetical protein
VLQINDQRCKDVDGMRMMNVIYLFISSFALVLGLIEAAVSQTTLPTSPYCTKLDFGDHEDPKAQEATCLQKLSRTASRSGNTLTLRLSNGATKTYRGNPEACRNDNAEKCVDYRLVGYHHSARLFLVLVRGYETRECQLVNAQDGTTSKYLSVPHFAPDGSTFIVVNDDITGARKYDVVIGSVATNPPVTKWGLAANDNEIWEFQRGLDKDRVALKNDRQEGILIRAGNSWSLQRKPRN